MDKPAKRNHYVFLKSPHVWWSRQFSFLLLLVWSVAWAMSFFTKKTQQSFANSPATISLSPKERNTTLLNDTSAVRDGWNSSLRTSSMCFTVGFKSTNNGIGNHLFFFAGVMHGAWLTGRKPIILSSRQTKLDKAFDLNTTHMDNSMICPVKHIDVTDKYVYNYDIEFLNDVEANVSIWLQGTFCSWKYTQPIEAELRRKLRFRQELMKFANTFLSANVPRGWKPDTFVRVGVHVRRGDYLRRSYVNAGFTVASKDYLKTAMTYFVKRYTRIQFIVASNGIAWCLKNIELSSFDRERINITFSVRHSTEQDLVLLASCDHMIMTTGTYSWWAAWLANGTTIYYKNFPRRGSLIWHPKIAVDYFPPWWIGI